MRLPIYQFGPTHPDSRDAAIATTVTISHRQVWVKKLQFIYKTYFSTNQKTISYTLAKFILLNSLRYSYQNY